MGVMAEAEAALGTVLSAATAGDSWAGVGTVQHQVHMVEGAGAEREEEEAKAPGSDTE